MIELDWHIWNSENKKIYLMILSNIKPLRMQFSKDVALNYQLAVSVILTIIKLYIFSFFHILEYQGSLFHCFSFSSITLIYLDSDTKWKILLIAPSTSR